MCYKNIYPTLSQTNWILFIAFFLKKLEDKQGA